MIFAIRSVVLTAVFTVMFTESGSAQSRHIEPTLCSADEQILLSCGVAHHKIVSICATKKVSKTSGYFQYRFGKLGKIELQYPPDLENSVSKFRFSGAAHSGGGRYHLRFTNEGYEYLVYNTETRGKEWAGVLVRKGYKIVSHLQCQIGEYAYLAHDAFYVPEREVFEDIDALP